MADALSSAILCRQCQQIFEGHWAPKESPEIAAQSQSRGQTGESDGHLGESPTDGLPSPENTDTSSEDDWYENPDWVKVITVDETGTIPSKATSSLSPQHHSILNLEESARNGCHLCTIFWDIVPDKIDELESAAKENLARLIGVVIARPHSEDDGSQESVALEISYFVDGEVAREAYVFTVGVQLVNPKKLSNHPLRPQPSQQFDRLLPLRSLEQINHWISECITGHQECKGLALHNQDVSGGRRLPTRLLRVESTEGCPVVSLRETRDLEASTSYTTLSHCWGGAPMIRLLSGLYAQFTQGIAFESLPKTFQDAVIFTITLGIEFLWIDSLCIIQDSEDDWLREALLMSSVYSNSWVNFAATSSRDGRGGLFLSNNALLLGPCLVEVSWTGLEAGVYLCLDETAWERRIENGPLNRRGWVLQERLLAPRTIHCAYDQLWWSCASTQVSCCEMFPDGAPIQTSHPASAFLTAMRFSRGNDMISSNENWLVIVGDYTKAALTYGSDKLVALAGIAEAAMQAMNVPRDSYLAGLWRVDLVVDLLWRMAATGSRPAAYRAPSWSWASVDGEVFFHSAKERDTARKNLLANVLEAHVSPVRDPLGPVKRGHLTVQGPLLKINLTDPDTSSPGNAFLGKLSLGNTCLSSDSGFAEALDHEPLYYEWPAEGKQVYFACFMTTSEPEIGKELESAGLILEPTGSSPGEYRRIGWMRIFHESPASSLFADAARVDALVAEEYLQCGERDIYSYRII